MESRIIIGTVAFMLTMIILGFVSLQEPSRLEVFSDAYEGRSIENGAEIYVNNCSTCHGQNGQAEMCLDPVSGEQIGCVGRPLNSAELLCGTRSARMEALDWSGPKYDFIEATVAAGRPWNGMPTWGEAYGGPLPQNQVRDVTLFVLNWEDEGLCEVQEVVGPEWPLLVSDLPAPDLANGEELYDVTYACASCHGTLDDADSAAIGPWLGNLADRVPLDEYTPADYMYESILMPNEYIALECPNGPCTEPSAMPGNFGERMTLQEMSDIIGYVLGATELESNVEVEYPEGPVPPQTIEEP